MSWWDPTNSITSLASQALKTAQKKIDKVLEITENESSGKGRPAKAKGEVEDSPVKDGDSWNSWNSWLGMGNKTSASSEEETEDNQVVSSSSWNLPWRSPESNTGPKTASLATDSHFPHLAPISEQTSKSPGRLKSTVSRGKKISGHIMDTETENSKPASLKKIESEDGNAENLSKDINESVSLQLKQRTVVCADMAVTNEPWKDKNTTAFPNVREQNVDVASHLQSQALVGEVKSHSSSSGHDFLPQEQIVAAENQVKEQSQAFNMDEIQSSSSDHDLISQKQTVAAEIQVTEESQTFKKEVIDEICSSSSGQDCLLQVQIVASEIQLIENNSNLLDIQPATESELYGEVDKHEKSVSILSPESTCISRTSDIMTESEFALSLQVVDTETKGGTVDSGLEIVIETYRQDEDNLASSLQDEIPLTQMEEVETKQSEDPVLQSDCSLSVQYIGSAGDAPAEVHSTDLSQVSLTSSVNLVSKSQEFGFETISRDSSKEALENMNSVICAQTQSSSGGEPFDELSYAQLTSSEDFQVASTSFMSSSSEVVMLSMSTEEMVSTLAQSESDILARKTDNPETQSLNMMTLENKNDLLLDAPSLQDDKSSQLDSTITSSSNESETSRLDSSMDTLVDKSNQLQCDLEGVDAFDESSMHWVESSKVEDDSHNNSEALSSPTASFVKCMIEEAMEDSSRHEDSSSDNHSEEKSESSKIDSEMEKSVYSGHESSDEIETTTSSDIEIISTPTPNGEKNTIDLSPLRISLQKAASARGHAQRHYRSDSQSSSSTHSKGDGEQLSPERDSDHERHEWRSDGKGQHQHISAVVSNDDLDNPQHPQRLLKNCKNQQEKEVVKKLAEMAEILQARETKLVQLSKDNNDLLETNSILRNQLQQLEETHAAEMTDLSALTEEFTRRMGESERKLQVALKEKDTLKQQLQLTQSELAKRSEDTNLQALLEEKNEQIAGLLEEGEKLSKQQLQNSTIIKKLRSKEKENEGMLASQKKKIEQLTEDLEKLKTVLDSKEDMEKKQADAIKQLNAAVQLMEKDKFKMMMEMESANEKIRGLQVTLDNSYKEIAELHKSNAAQDSKAQAAALSAEMQVREELKMAMEQEQQQFKRERETRIMQIEDLQLSITRMEKEHNRREEMLKQEIADLQYRLQEDESRSQDLTQSITSATRPLLRQIENLQTTHNIQAAAWETVEKNLTERLSEGQTLLAVAQERERAATEKLVEMNSRCAALDASNSQLRLEKAQLLAQQSNDRRRIDLLEDRKAGDIAQLEIAKQRLSDEVAALRKNQVFLETQLETERSRVDAERQRVAVAEEQIRILEREQPRSRGTPSPVSVSRQESMCSSFSEQLSSTTNWLHHRQEDGEGHISSPIPRTSVYESLRQSGAAALMENLQSQLKLREGEIIQLQADIQQLERTRESMARELVNLTNKNEELQEKIEELPMLQSKFEDLNGRYNALLQMYGEKEEQVQELLLDLQDVKDMYKTQINSLMPK